MTTPYEVLSRIASRPSTAGTGERCEMCAEAIGDVHRHVVNIQGRQLMCVCRGCHLLFTDSTAELRYRAVPDRYLAFPDFEVGTQLWAAAQIPVDLAFLFHNSVLHRAVVFYPGPAGATESEMDSEAWEHVVDADPRVGMMTADVEALLMRATGSHTQCFLVPIDACYELVGGLRRRWRGFDGGQQARRYLDEFFEQIAGRARGVPR